MSVDKKMKAVAGQELVSKREIDIDEEEEIEVDPAPAHFLPVINRVCELMDADDAATARETGCFGHLWEDSEGVCPEASECDISSYCQAVYKEVTQPGVSDALDVDSEEHEEEIEEPVEDIEDELIAAVPSENKSASITNPGALKKPSKKSKSKKKKKSPNRGQYAQTPKYDRLGYSDMGRPVDQAVRRFIHELEYPYELPKAWSRRNLMKVYGDKGDLLLSKTASYHAVFVKGNMAARFWTNAAGYAIVDLSHVLVEKFKLLGMPVIPIPPKAKNSNKYKEFGGRMYVKNEEDADRLAHIIKETYQVTANAGS